MKRLSVIPALLLAAFGALAQTPPAVASFPDLPIPAAVAAVGEFNQLGSPRFTLGLSAIYPVIGKVGVYGSTTADILPRKAVDPATGKSFYALQTSVRQGLHKDLIDTGRFSFLLGGDLGPSFSSATAGMTISFSSSFVATAVYQITPMLSFVAPVRMLYVTGVGWNPVMQAGFAINLSKLPKSTKQ